MRFLPVGLDVRARACVVIGGGAVGTRKVRTLLGAGASVTVVSPQGTDELARLASEGRLRWVAEPYAEGHTDGAFLAVAATSDERLNTRVVEDAVRGGALACDASSAERSQLIFGALHRGGGVTVAVFTDGEDPSRARRARDRIAEAQGEWEVVEEED